MVDLNEREALAYKERLGYGPNPHCQKCKGFGHIHPYKGNGEPDYSKAIMCPAPGCLRESYEQRRPI